MKINALYFFLIILLLAAIGCDGDSQSKDKELSYREVCDTVFMWENRQWKPMQLITTSYNEDNQIEKITEKVFLIPNRPVYKRIQELRAAYYHRDKILTKKTVPEEGCWVDAQYTEYLYNDQKQLIEMIERHYESDELTNFRNSIVYEYNASGQPAIITSRNTSSPVSFGESGPPDSAWTVSSKDSIIYNDDGLKAEKYTYRNRPTPSYWYSYSYDSITSNEITKRMYNTYSESWTTFEKVQEVFDVQGNIFEIRSGRVYNDEYVINQVVDRWFNMEGKVSNELTYKVYSDSASTRELQSSIDYEYDERGNLILKTHKTIVNGLSMNFIQERFSYEEFFN